MRFSELQARHVARARESFERVDLSALREALEGVDGVADKIAKRSKFMAWWKAESDQVKLQECVDAVREAMRDTSFGASVEIAGKLDGLRGQFTDLAELLGENMAELRGELAARAARHMAHAMLHDGGSSGGG